MKTFKDLEFKKHKGGLFAEILFHNNYGIDCTCLDNSISDKSGFLVMVHTFDGESYDYAILGEQVFVQLYKDQVDLLMEELQQLPSYKGEKK